MSSKVNSTSPLVFDDGTQLSLSVTNTRILADAYGTDAAKWIGKEIELNVGETAYEGKPQESILVKPISPPVEKKTRGDGTTPARRIRRSGQRHGRRYRLLIAF